jgi:hypothetical protein
MPSTQALPVSVAVQPSVVQRSQALDQDEYPALGAVITREEQRRIDEEGRERLRLQREREEAERVRLAALAAERANLQGRGPWWTLLGFTQEEGGANIKINYLANVEGTRVHASIVKADVPADIDFPDATTNTLTSTILGGNSFHVTMEVAAAGRADNPRYYKNGDTNAAYDGSSQAIRDGMRTALTNEWDRVKAVVAEKKQAHA